MEYSKNNQELLIDSMKSFYSFPSKTMLSIREWEYLHKRKVYDDFSGFFEIFECSYDLILDLTQHINYVDKKHWTHYKILQFLLLKNSLYSLYSAFNRFENGFYDDSVILLRTTYEAFVRMLYLSYYSDDPERIFRKKSEKGKPSFNLQNFLEHKLKVDWRYLYSLMSAYSHGYSYQTLSESIEISKTGQKEAICMKLEFDRDSASRPMNITFFLLWGIIRLSKILFFDVFEYKFQPDFEKKIYATEIALGSVIKTMKNKMSLSYNDLLRISDEILNIEKLRNSEIKLSKEC